MCVSLPITSGDTPVTPHVSTPLQVSSKLDWVNMIKMQQMVRVTCLEVMGAAPTQIEDFRREVIELQRVIQAFRDDVQQLRSNGSSAASDVEPASPATPQTVGEATITLRAKFEVCGEVVIHKMSMVAADEPPSRHTSACCQCMACTVSGPSQNDLVREPGPAELQRSAHNANRWGRLAKGSHTHTVFFCCGR